MTNPQSVQIKQEAKFLCYIKPQSGTSLPAKTASVYQKQQRKCTDDGHNTEKGVALCHKATKTKKAKERREDARAEQVEGYSLILNLPTPPSRLTEHSREFSFIPADPDTRQTKGHSPFLTERWWRDHIGGSSGVYSLL